MFAFSFPSRTMLSMGTAAASLFLIQPAGAHTTYLPAVEGSPDDTARIEQALDACNSPARRCTVRLGPGTFRIGLLVVEDFHGAFLGAGAGQTVIEALPRIRATFTLFEPQSKTNRMPNLITFMSGSFTVADMSIRVTEYHPLEAYQWLPGLPDTYFMNCVLGIIQKPGGTPPHARVERVELSGADGDAGPFYGYSLPPGQGVNTNGLLFFGGFLLNRLMSGGSLVVRDSVLRRGVTGFLTLRTVGSHVSFAGNRVSESVDGVAFNLLSDSTVLVRDNVVSTWEWGVSFLQTPFFDFEGWGPPEATRAVVSRNVIRTSQIMDKPTAGVIATDDYVTLPNERPRLALVVAGNSVIAGGDTWPSDRYGILLRTTAGALVARNTTTGAGAAALGLEGSRSARLLFNELGGFAATKAHLWFSPASQECVALGVHPSDTVLDEGVDNVVMRMPSS
jgi:hypothetical protein